MPSRPVLRLLGPLLGLLVAGCRPPEPNPGLIPASPVRWEAGRGWMTQTADGVTASVAFLEAGPGAYLFEVALDQTAGDPVTLSPETIQFVVEDPEGCLPTPAEDPEAHLAGLRRAEALELQSQAQVAGLSLVGDFLDLASLARPLPPAERARRDAARSRRQADEARAAETSQRLRERLASDRQHWERAALRRTTLAPGGHLQGKVVVRRLLPHARRVSLQLPVGPRRFVFAFRVEGG